MAAPQQKEISSPLISRPESLSPGRSRNARSSSGGASLLDAFARITTSRRRSEARPPSLEVAVAASATSRSPAWTPARVPAPAASPASPRPLGALLRRIVAADSVPSAVAAGAACVAPRAWTSSVPVVNTLVEALANAGYPGAPATEVNPVSLVLSYERVRAGVNAALKGADATWRDVASHVIAAVAGLAPHVGFAYALWPATALRPGDPLTWDCVSSLTSSESAVSSVARMCRGASTLVQLSATRPGALWGTRGVGGAEPGEVVAGPGATFRVTWSGELAGGARWLCVAQEESAPAREPAQEPPADERPAPADEETLARSFRAVDAGDAAAAVRMLQRMVGATEAWGKLAPPACLFLRGLLLAWPWLFGAVRDSEAALLDRAATTSADRVPECTRALDELAGSVSPASPTAQWLCGYWRILVAKDYDEGARLVALAAESAHPLGRYSLAQCREKGVGCGVEGDEAMRLYAQSAAAGCACALVGVGLMHRRGGGSAEPNSKEAARWLALAADAGSPSGLYHFSVCLREGSGVDANPEQALRLLRRAADLDDRDAQYALAMCYVGGELGLPADKDAARKLLEQAAGQGHAGAQCQLGIFIFEEADAKDEKLLQAAKYFSSAAEQGDTKAMYYVGACLEDGLGMRPNAAEAVRWYEAAANAGNPAGLYKLGMCHLTGTGVKKDHKAAVMYLQNAADNGSRAASEALRTLPGKKGRSMSLFSK
eukprot:m51a1_g5237 hypothetical protein (720) ;mRNA; r:335964-338182